MRIKSVKGDIDLSIDKIYHLIKEDDEFYYVVNDIGKITKYPKKAFVIVEGYVIIDKEVSLLMPNDEVLSLKEGSKYKVDGKFVMNYNDKIINMYVFRTREDTVPIAVNSELLKFVES